MEEKCGKLAISDYVSKSGKPYSIAYIDKTPYFVHIRKEYDGTFTPKTSRKGLEYIEYVGKYWVFDDIIHIGKTAPIPKNIAKTE